MLASELNPGALFDRSGFDALLKDIKSASQFTRVLIEVFRERAQLESDYSKGLSRLHSRLSKAAEALSGTVASAWQQTVSSLETEALVHRTISEQLQSQLLPSSKEFSAGLDRQLKPACSEVDAASSRLLSCRRVEWKLRKKAFAAYRLACNSLTTQASCGARLEARVARAGTMLPPGVGGVGMGGGITPKLAPARPGSGHGAGSELQSETSRTRVVEKSVTLPLPSACPPRDGDQSSSLDSAVILTQTSQCLANQSSLPEKLTKSVWQSVFHHYQSSLASEEARIEWHSALFQNSFKLYELERGRLEHLCDTLTSYRTTVFDNLRCLNAADRTIQEAVDKVDKAADFAKFCSSLCNRSTKASRPTVTRPISVDLSGSGAVGDWAKMKSLARHSQSPEPKSDEQQPVVGGSKQSLIFLPGEVDSCFNTPPELQRFSVQCMLQKRLLVLPSSEKNTPESLKDSALKVEKATFSRCMLTVISSLLAREATKEERTKQGLTNLVEVYSSTPTFADESTLAEARRRLFISRCRLAYVTACRARLACLLAPDDSSHSTSLSSLRKRLSGAGFANSKDLPVRLLAVPTKDQTEVQRYASLPLTRWLDVRTPVEVPIKILEWPPVSSDLWKMECLPDNELHLLNLTAILSYPDTNWVMAATASRTNALQDLQATDTLADLTDSDFESDLEEDQQPGVVPNFVLPNGHPVAQLKLDIQTVPQSAPPQLSASPQTVNSDNASPECPSAPAPVEKSRKLRFIRKFKCGQSMRRRPLSPDKRTSPPPPVSAEAAFMPSFVAGTPEAFMDEEEEEEEEYNGTSTTTATALYDYPPFRLVLDSTSSLADPAFKVDLPDSYATVCPECYPLLQERRSMYVSARIRVRLIPCPSETAAEQTCCGAPQQPSFVDLSADKSVAADSGSSSDIPPDTPLAEKAVPTGVECPSSALRRSSRTRGARDDFVLRVDSSSKLQDIRVQMMKLIDVAPFDQHLSLGGVEFTDYSRTLVQLGIQPDSLLYLWVDLPPADSADLERSKKTGGAPNSSVSYSRTSEPVETGFKGTRLLNSWSPEVAVSNGS
uniref:FCH domain-containing protein n=1 Tax=Schistocephalus solidus TaxID=70667 RepID=A0A0X3NMR6_SCHSO